MADINLGVGGANSAVGGYDIANSLKMESDNTEYITRTNSSASNSKTFTFSGWYKFTELKSLDSNALYEATGGGPLKHFSIYTYNYTIGFYDYLGGVDYGKRTTQLFRDTSAWYHIMVVIDTTDSTAADRSKMYVNGVRITDWASDAGDFPLNFDTQVNKVNIANRIGRTEHQNGEYLNGYVAEVHMVDGQALAPTDFGEFDADTGIWKPIETNISSYGTNGFYLKFDNASDLGEDASGGSSFTLNNITSADQATDTPTNNFATLNPLFRFDECTIFAGATRVKKTTTNRWRTFVSSIGVTSGKWYAEFQNPLHAITGTDRFIGVAPATIFNQSIAATGGYLGGNSTETTDSIGYHGYTGNKFINGTGSSFGNTYAGETVAIALDMDNGYVYFAKANTWQNSGDPTSGATGTGGIALQLPNDTHYLACSIYDTNADFQANYGGYTDFTIASAASDANGYGNFEYAPPSGYYALCSKNLAQYG